jgi:hypothetical protein
MIQKLLTVNATIYTRFVRRDSNFLTKNPPRFYNPSLFQ